MKRRTLLAKNRKALKTGIPPYTRQKKRPFLYSTAYRDWYKATTKRATAGGEQRQAA